MSLPLERWARQAVLLERKGDFAPVADSRVLADVDALKALHRQQWKQRWRELDGVPVALEGTYAGLNAYPPSADLAVTSISGTAALWTSSLWTPIGSNAVIAPEAYRIAMTAKITTSTTPANIGFDPRIGAGSNGWLGDCRHARSALSTNVALTASITASYYYVIGDLTLRTVGGPGRELDRPRPVPLRLTQATSAGLAGPAVVGVGHNLLFGTTVASFD